MLPIRKRSTLRPIAVLLAAGSLGGLLAACSGAGHSAASGRAGSCQAPGVTATEIKAGLLFSDTGPGASGLTAFRAGVDARLGVANAAGGVNGRKIVYAWRDDATEPTLNLAAARELINDEHTFGLMEGPTDASGSAAYLGGQRIPVVGLAGETAWARHNNMFSWHYYVGGAGSTSVWGAFVHSQGGTRAAVLDLALDPAGQIFHREVAASLQSAGVTVALNADVTAGATTFNALVGQLKAANIDTLAGVLYPQTLAALLPAARAAGINLKVVLTPIGYDPRVLQPLGKTLAGTVIYVDFVPFELNTAAHKQLLTAMADYAPQIQPPTQESAVYGWLSADMFLRGLQAAGSCPTRQSFITGLRAVRNYTGGGLLPQPVDFATNLGTVANCYDFVQISADGSRFVPLRPALRCGNLIGVNRG
jgi:branched-chain amino acid transport system substrate-binding protein